MKCVFTTYFNQKAEFLLWKIEFKRIGIICMHFFQNKTSGTCYYSLIYAAIDC